MPNDYGGFTMPGNDFFYLSSMYNDKLLTEFLPVVKNKAYQRYMQIQKDILNGNEICGTLGKSNSKYYFKESLELNSYFDFPLGSIYLDVTDQGFFYDIADKMAFIRTYTSYTTPISSTEIMKNPDIFNYTIRCMIGDYFFNKFYLVKDKYRRLYIVIKNSTTDGLPSSIIKRLINEGTDNNSTPFIFWKDMHSACYTYSGALNTIIFNSSTSGMKRINIPKLTKLSPLYHIDQNNWSIVMSYDSIRYGNNLYAMTNASLVSENSTTLTFDIPEIFVNDILTRNTILNCAAVQKPNRKAIYAYNPSTNTEPWLTLGDTDKPVSIANIKLYQYNESTASYKRRIPIETSNFNQEFNSKVNKEDYNENNLFSNIIFPSIYQFDSITTPIRIELINFNSNISNTSFANHIKGLFVNNKDNETIEYSASKYLEYLTWLNNNKNNQTYSNEIINALNLLTNYNPCNIYMDYTDYKQSGLSLREYKFSKLMKLISSDPYIYSEYIKYMDKENFNIIRESGSPKHFKLNTGLTGNLTGTNPVVTDDQFTCVNKNDEVYFFNEPHSYIKIHSENDNAFCIVYIGGRIIIPTRVKSKLNEIYIFLPQSKIQEYINESVKMYYNQTSLNENNLITVELYNKIDRSNINQVHNTNIFESTSIPRKFFNGDESFKFKLSDLVIYNKITGKYIPLNKFNISAILHKGTIEFDDGTTDTVIGTPNEIIYLGTNLGEYYMTKDNLRIILDEETEEYPFPNDSTTSGGINDNYSGFLNKIWSANDLKFILNDPKLVGTEIEVVYSPMGYTWNIPFSKFIDISTANSPDRYQYKLGGFIGINDPKLFELYINGEFVDPEKYLTMPSGVSTNDFITIILPSKFSGYYTNGNITDVQLVYNPTTYNRAYGNKKYIITAQNIEVSNDDLTKVYDINCPLYEVTDTYFNSDNSKTFIYNQDSAIIHPYTWYQNNGHYDIQDLLNTSKLHPIIPEFTSTNVLIEDLQRDISFITNTKANNARSIIDQITISKDI